MIGKIKVEFDSERNTSISVTVDDKPLHDMLRIDSVTVDLSESKIPKVGVGILVAGVEISTNGEFKINNIVIPDGIKKEVIEAMHEALAEYYSERELIEDITEEDPYWLDNDDETPKEE